MLVVLSDSRPTTTPVIDLGAQSDHGTQFLFSEGDVRDSDADLVDPPALAMHVISLFH